MGDPVFKPGEWYSDVPWHQKLGTFAGNEIDEALVIPYEALGANELTYCNNNNTFIKTPGDCMIETGINSILGAFRRDTLYNTSDALITKAQRCADGSTTAPCNKTALCLNAQQCIEVKLQLAMFWTRSDPAGKTLQLQMRPFGNDQGNAGPNFGGYVITDGTTYAPQMPWYMSHYCEQGFTTSDALDPTCYADYFTTFNDGFQVLSGKPANGWPDAVTWSVWPTKDIGFNHCNQPGITVCTLVMGAFDLSAPVTSIFSNLQYYSYSPPQNSEPDGGPNNRLFKWFNGALAKFPTNYTSPDFYRHFPWSGAPVTWGTTPSAASIDLYPQAQGNPFLGQHTFSISTMLGSADCTISLDKADPPACKTRFAQADHYLYPRQCKLIDLAAADPNVARLRACGLNFELHHNGWLEQYQGTFPKGDLVDTRAGMLANQYGRTSFLFAGVPGMQLPVSYYKPSGALSVYEQVNNASIFGVYLPIANEADFKDLGQRNYSLKEFYHTLLMTNHMESDPDEFAEGIRGKVLWHNEYRTQKMYDWFVNKNNSNKTFPTRMFAGAFDPTTAPAPFHNNTCDGCHVRNGSGIPTTTAGTLDPKLQGFMTSAAYDAGGQIINPPRAANDYTFTGILRPMKLVFFDLKRVLNSNDQSDYSKPQVVQEPSTAPKSDDNDPYYFNKIMNFYGDSFHVAKPDSNKYPVYDFAWTYAAASSDRIVVKQPDGTPTPRVNQELKNSNCTPTPTCYTYQPYQVNLGQFKWDPACQLLPKPKTVKPWPETCDDINSDAIHAVTDGVNTRATVGFMLLNGKRVSNSSAIEAIPNTAIIGFNKAQTSALGTAMAGEVQYNGGTRGGVGGDVKTNCRKQSKSLTDCWIGRFGWLGDRVSLEDQVANAAFVEMNMTTSGGYQRLYGTKNVEFPFRYNAPDCGPADKQCVASKNGNGDLSEMDINRMAAYARWTGNPTRSEFTASLPDVIAGETVFNNVSAIRVT